MALTALMWLTVLNVAVGGGATVSGHVLAPDGTAAAQARVFLESGRALVQKTASADGAFQFEEVPPGIAGVFAIADGAGFGGASVTVAVGDAIGDLSIRLGALDSISGKITDPKGKPVAGARVTGVVLLGDTKVGIPYSSLAALGVLREPVSAADGTFTVSQLPQGRPIALKIGHMAYAQEALGDLTVGDHNVRATLYPGVLVRGNVLAQGGGMAVADATVIVKNAQPPHDSVVVASDMMGAFSLRLKPGVYLYQAESTKYRSPGWEALTVSGEKLEQSVTLRVAGMAPVYGKVMDAVSGAPVPGARLTLSCNGAVAALVRTGPTGEYRMSAIEGENFVKLDAAPGYLPPTNPALRINVQEGKPLEIPEFWLAPLPSYRVCLLDVDGRPAAGVIVRVLRPVQFGWNVTDAEGKVTLQFMALPADGRVVGMAEHPSKPLGALFALDRTSASEAKVQLLSLATVRGRVVNESNKPLAGALVGALFADDSPNEALLTWRTLSREDGSFEWQSTTPFLPQRCLAYAGAQASAESESFNVKPEAREDVGSVTISGGVNGASAFGKPLKWYDNRLLGGTLPEHSARKGLPAVVLYCSPEEASAAIDAMTRAKALAGQTSLIFAVVVKGEYSCGDAAIPVLSGSAPTTATTYLVDADGNVCLETFDLPPLRALYDLAHRAPTQ